MDVHTKTLRKRQPSSTPFAEESALSVRRRALHGPAIRVKTADMLGSDEMFQESPGRAPLQVGARPRSAAAVEPSRPGPLDRFTALLEEVWQGFWTRETWPGTAQLRLLAVFLIAGVCSWAGIVLSHQSEGVSTIWLSNGVIFGLLITQPRGRWPGYFLAGLGADTLADMIYGDPFRIAVGVSLANSVEVVASTLLLTLWFGSPLDLSKRRPLIGFLLVSVIGATALSSALGASWTLFYMPAGPWWSLFRTWYLGDMLGIAILAPLIVTLQRPAFFSMLQRERLPYTLLALLGPILVSVLVFTHESDPLTFLIFPMLLIVAFRLGQPGTVLTIVLVTLIAIGFTVKGHGPLMLIQGEHMLLHRIVVAQIFAAVCIFTMFPVAALLEERESLKASLAHSEMRYRRLAHADELTGLFNRRAFNLSLERVWMKATTDQTSVALLLLDADSFKQYNDLFGHLAGDECLRSLAVAIGAAAGDAHGTTARFGGEEFAVILPGARLDTACTLAERIREAVVRAQLPHPGTPSGVATVSVGVAALYPARGQSSSELVSIADQALYTAKLSGRNQVISGPNCELAIDN